MRITDDERRIIDAVNACEGGSDAHAAGDDGRGGTDAHMDESEAAEGYHIVDVSDKFNENIAAIDFVQENGGLEAVKARLMPEGMEWPRYESGEPVRPGDRILDGDGDWFEAVSFMFTCDWWSIRGYQTEGFGDLNDKTRRSLEGMAYGTRVKRPAPKVLDADGVEIRVGDTVCGTRDMEPMRVVDTDSRECGFKHIKCEKDGDGFFFYCADELTHKLPILAADGEPLEVGDRVWWTWGGQEYVVEQVRSSEEAYVTLANGEFSGHSANPRDLTHQRPVLDAEGNRIKQDMDVWWICEGDERGIHAERLHVDGIDEDGMVECSLCHGGTWVELEPSELYVKKPVPAADGEPLEVGQTVYALNDDRPYTVKKVETNRVSVNAGEGAYDVWKAPTYLTHQRPVLDADGVPIKVGDTVYFTDGREQKCNTVVNAEYDYKDEPYVQLGRLNEAGYPTYTNCSCIDPSRLTHTKPEPPDSWERIEKDVDTLVEAEDNGVGSFSAANDYCERHGLGSETVWVMMARDLVRRCKEVARKENNNE